MTTLTHIFGASDDLIEVSGAISDELYPRLDDASPDVVAVGVDTPTGRGEVLLAVEYGRDGIWHITPQTRPELVTITPARGEDAGDDVDGCPGYSDKATIAATVTDVHLVSQEGDR